MQAPFGTILNMATLHTVTLPTGTGSSRNYECSEGETILQAGLRAGLPLRYKCLNGSCGECKSQLLEGQITSLRPHDFSLSSQAQQAGWFLSCTHAPASNIQLSAPLFGSVQQVPHQTIQCKVKKITILPDGMAILTLKTPRSNTFQFLAGQSVTLSHLLVEKRYPIASCPCNGGELEFHIPQRAEDPFSQLLFSSLKRGERVTIEGPYGQFSLDEASKRPLVFIAWEHGFAPVRSLVDHLISLEMENPVSLYRIARNAPYLNNHAKAWHAILEPFDDHWISYSSAQWDEPMAELLNTMRQRLEIRNCDFYIAAPAPFLIALSEQLLDIGVKEEQLHAAPL